MIALLLGILTLFGCQPPQQNIDPNAAISSAPIQVISTTDAKDQAVSMYVDAMMLNDLNEREEALRKLNQALELDPRFSMAYSLKGDILQNMEQYEDSANAYEQATVYDPWSFKDFFNLGKVCQVIKQWARAAKAYASACALDPKHYPAHLGAAQCFYELKEYENSVTYAQKAKELDPVQADPEQLLGDVFEAQKDHLQAINAYRRALELGGNKPDTMIALARAYLRSGRYNSAKEVLNDVITTDPQNSLAYQYLGFAQLKLKEIDLAVESYRQAVRANDNDWMAHKGLGVAYMLTAMKNQNDEKARALAIEQWTISLQLKPDQPKLQQLVDRYSR
jgi:tetratricopeptide (TPR) repeat protein